MLLRSVLTRPDLRPLADPRPVSACPVRPRENGRRFSYDLDDLVLDSSGDGPFIRDRPVASRPRRAEEIEATVQWRRRELTGCYRWALVRSPDLGGRMGLQIEVDEAGGMVTRVVEPVLEPRLAGCVEDVLRGLELNLYTPRTTVLVGAIEFRRDGRLKKTPPRGTRRPAIEPAASPGGRRQPVRPVPGLPLDHVAASEAIVKVDDYDVEQYQAEAQERHAVTLRAWERAGQRGPAPELEKISTGFSCGACRIWGADRETVSEAVDHNTGAYRRCLLEARTRRPSVSGAVPARMKFDGCGRVQSVELDDAWTLQDDRFAACLRHTLSEVDVEMGTYDGGEARVRVVVPPPPRAPPPTQDGAPPAFWGTAENLEAWAGASALNGEHRHAWRHHAALLERLPTSPRACLWQVGALDARQALYPWEHEAILDELEALVATALKPGAAAGGCAGELAQRLKARATQFHRRFRVSKRLTWLRRAGRAYALYLRLPQASHDREMHFQHAEALLTHAEWEPDPSEQRQIWGRAAAAYAAWAALATAPATARAGPAPPAELHRLGQTDPAKREACSP
jgi:hypothetical protein